MSDDFNTTEIDQVDIKIKGRTFAFSIQDTLNVPPDADLTEEASRQPGLFAHLGVLKAKAHTEMRKTRDVLFPRWDQHARYFATLSLVGSGHKTTIEAVSREVRDIFSLITNVNKDRQRFYAKRVHNTELGSEFDPSEIEELMFRPKDKSGEDVFDTLDWQVWYGRLHKAKENFEVAEAIYLAADQRGKLIQTINANARSDYEQTDRDGPRRTSGRYSSEQRNLRDEARDEVADGISERVARKRKPIRARSV